MKKTLFEDYSEFNRKIINSINSLPSDLAIKFNKKLRAEKNRTNFLSLLSELRFVIFFIQEGLDFDYDIPYKNLRPDIRLKLSEQEVIGDIKRFNLSEEDQIKQEFFYRLRKNLKTINKPYYIHIEQTKSFDYNTVDVNVIKKDFEIWVNDGRIKIGDSYDYKDLLSIKITKLNSFRPQINISSRILENIIHPDKISGILIEKIARYEATFIDPGFPFFVCVDLSFKTMVDPEDFKNKLQLPPFINKNELTQLSSFGDFYKNQKIRKILGVLIRYNNEFYWIRNPEQQELLNFKSTKNL